ncbi:helicase RepA family protein [Aeromonas veronii]|uniref:helicase RepA family protein n=1 Tax=Aeromonas veronii TaxID=654 RepID=UPI000D75E524
MNAPPHQIARIPHMVANVQAAGSPVHDFVTFRDLPDQRTIVIYTGSHAPSHGRQREVLQRALNHAITADNPVDPDEQPVVSLYVSPNQLDEGEKLYRMVDRDATEKVIVHICGQLHVNKQLRLIDELLKQAPGADLYLGHPDRNAEPWALVNIHQQFESQKRLQTNLSLSIGFSGYDRQQSYLIKGLLPASSMCSIYGPSGSFKSFTAVSIACHISTGLAWDGRPVQKGAVLYIVGEGGVGVPRRIKAWADEYHEQQDVPNLYRVNQPVFMADDAQVNELRLAAIQIKADTGLPVRLIVVDTVARCFGGGDENRAADMGAFIAGCDRIKAETGATILLIHHTGKNEENGARGSSAFRAALDAEYLLKRENKEDASIILTCTKMKDDEEPDRRAHDLKQRVIGSDAEGDDVTSMVLVDTSREPIESDELGNISNVTANHKAMFGAIRQLCNANGGKTTWQQVIDHMKAAKMDDSKNRTRHRNKLISERLIERDGDVIWLVKSGD